MKRLKESDLVRDFYPIILLATKTYFLKLFFEILKDVFVILRLQSICGVLLILKKSEGQLTMLVNLRHII